LALAAVVVIPKLLRRLTRPRWQPKGKSVVITGASSGIGAAFAKHFSRPGVTIAITGRRQEQLEQVANECTSKGATVVQGIVDVTDRKGMDAWLTKLDSQYPVDLIIANAVATSSTLNVQGDLETAARMVYGVNIDGTFNTIFPLLKNMKQRGYGQIAIMSSVSGLGPVKGMFEYASSKAALKVFAESLRWVLYRDNIHVTALVPGFFPSNLTEKNKGPMPFTSPVDSVLNTLVEGLRNDHAIAFGPGFASSASWLLLQALPDDARDALAKAGLAKLIAYYPSRPKPATLSTPSSSLPSSTSSSSNKDH